MARLAEESGQLRSDLLGELQTVADRIAGRPVQTGDGEALKIHQRNVEAFLERVSEESAKVRGQISNEIQQALMKLGGNAEGPILQAWPMVTTAAGKRVLIEVLGQVGGEPSIQLLQQLAESPDREVRIPATLAVKKIQSRR